MARKCNTTKYRKQHKKEKARRKVRIVKPAQPVDKPISAARKAFQDV